MPYATLLVYVNADHVSKQLVGVAAGLATSRLLPTLPALITSTSYSRMTHLSAGCSRF